MDDKPLIIGRDKERGQLDIAIGDGTDGLRLTWFSGPSGRGKTTLLTDAVEKSRDKGYQIAVARGRAGALSTPFAPWIEALPGFATVINEQASAGHEDIEEIGTALVAHLTEIAEEQPLLLAIDDAQALDESSIALLGYAAGINEDVNMALVFVEQDDAPGIPSSYRAFLDGLVARRIVNNIILGPMSDEAVTELVRHELEIDGEEDVPADIVIRAQGNPWFAKELSAAFTAGGDVELPTNIAAAASSRLHTLDEDSQDIVLAVALCPDGSQIGWLEALSGEKPRKFVRTIESIHESGLTREDGDIVAIAHPLMQEALLDEMSAAMKRALHLELVDAIDATPMSDVATARSKGFHLGKAGRLDDSVEQHLAAAVANEVAGKIHESSADYARALDSEQTTGQRVELLKKCAYMAAQINSPDASEYWLELGRTASALGDNETYAFALFQQYWTSQDGSLVDRLERATALGTDEYGWAARAAALLRFLDHDFAGAQAFDEKALELARDSNDAMLEALSLEKLAVEHIYQGRLDSAISYLREAISVGTAHRYHSLVAEAWYGLVNALSDNLNTEEAVDEARRAIRYVQDLGMSSYVPHLESALALALSRFGSLDEASKVVGIAYDAVIKSPRLQHSSMVAEIRAYVLAELGDATVAAQATEAARDLVYQEGYASHMFEVDFDAARALLVSGAVDKAIESALDLEVEEPLGMAELALWIARASWYHDKPEVRATVATMIEKLETDLPVVALSMREAQLLTGKPSKAIVDELLAVAKEWKAAGRNLDALRCTACAGIAAMKEGDKDQATSLLKSARSKLAEMGAAYDADVAAANLRKLGTRSRAKSRTSNVGDLTKRELQIARLVAQGLKNAEVAETLFLAEKTVAAHLSNIYGKVGVRSRVKLTAWLQDNDPELASAAV